MFRTLRGKFTLVYLALALLAALVGLAGVWNLQRLERSVNNLMTANYRSIDVVYHMMEAIERQDSAVLLYIGVDEEQGIALFSQNQTEFLQWLDAESDNVTEDGESTVLDILSADYEEYSATLYHMQQLSDKAARSDYYLNTIRPLFEQIKDQCRQLVQINETAMFAAKQRTTDDVGRSMLALLGAALLALAGGFAMSQFFIRRFLKPIGLLAQRMAQVREGSWDLQMEAGPNDETGRLVLEFNDMTRRLQDYERSSMGTLLGERNRSLAIVQSISDPLLVLDAGWRIQLANEAFLRAFVLPQGGEVAGCHFLEVIHDGALFAQLEEQVAHADADVRETAIHRVGERYYNLSVTRLHNGDGNTGTIAVLHDITELKELERVRTDFLASISHEFKTPLTSILMASSLLKEGGLGALSADQAQAIETVGEDGERLLNLVNDLLELMRMESGREVYHMERCSLGDIVRAAVDSFRETARRRAIGLDFSVPEALPPVHADCEKITWVLNNLISNALTYSGAGDAIDVTAQAERAFVRVSVRDTGIGIAPQHLERIFDRFVHGEAEDIEVRGTGVGLSVARQIVRDHGGDITVTSQEGAGSTFTFTLPVEEGARP